MLSSCVGDSSALANGVFPKDRIVSRFSLLQDRQRNRFTVIRYSGKKKRFISRRSKAHSPRTTSVPVTVFPEGYPCNAKILGEYKRRVGHGVTTPRALP